ncbi:hypothetical protein L3X38_029623 [Prunus dulcis]|uniref:Retroviral polymerase SH3-like domain-containing protein n=1 Tax=Prunus dulcis TaxID=3755 RepID=A0AAD4VRZ1_PRUDU|nr:hypothetical protein L3X38_029623 [Prunus dulcis]
MPSKVLANKSPYFRLMQKLPDIGYLRVFGTTVYPCLRGTNSHKLQPRTAACVFMGYLMGYKGVLCYNCSTQRFVISRHVIHDELVYPFKHPSTFHSNILSSVSPSLSINLHSTLVLSSETLVSHANHPSSSPSRREFFSCCTIASRSSRCFFLFGSASSGFFSSFVRRAYASY